MSTLEGDAGIFSDDFSGASWDIVRRLAILQLVMVAGCAVDFSSGLSMDLFAKSPDAVDVSDGQGNKTVTCDLTITGQGGAGGAGPDQTVRDTGCVFKSPEGRTASCLAASSVGDIWSCDVTILENTEEDTWTIDYVFARDMNNPPNQLFITGAEIEADQSDGEVDLAVTSTTPDTTPPVITVFTALPATVEPGGILTCTLTATDDSPIKDSGCTFLPDDASPSVSCIRHGALSCQIDIAADADAGVEYTEVNHFVRDTALNVSIGNDSSSFTVGTGGAGGAGGSEWTPFDPSDWPGPMTGTPCGLGSIGAECLCDGGLYTEGYCLATPDTTDSDRYYSFSDAPASTVYVVPGGVGGETGADWANADDIDALNSPVRDTFYWIASGDYNQTITRQFDTAASGTDGIVIRKATEAEHGTGTGWQTSYGQDRALFGAVAFGSNYWTIDGGEFNGLRFKTPALYGAGSPYAVFAVDAQTHIVARRVDIDAGFQGSGGVHTAGTCVVVTGYANRYVYDRCEMHDVADDVIEWQNMQFGKLYRNKIHSGFAAGTDGDLYSGPCFNGHTDLIELANDSDDNWIINNLVYDVKGGNGALITGNWDEPSPSERNLFINNLFFSQATLSPVELFDLEDSEFIGNIIIGTYLGNGFGGLTLHSSANSNTWVNNYFTTINTTLYGGSLVSGQTLVQYNAYGEMLPGEHTLQTGEIDLNSTTTPQFVGIPFSSNSTVMDGVAETLLLSDLEPATGGSLLGAGVSSSYNWDILGAVRPQTAHDIGAWDSISGGGAGGTGGTGGTGGAGGTGGTSCPAVANYTATNAWTAPQAEATATDTLTFEFYLRSQGTGNDAGIALFDTSTTTPAFDDAVALIRFSDLNEIEVADGATAYNCSPGACPSYTANTWYRFVLVANLTTDTYTVEYEACGAGSLQDLHNGADFRNAVTDLGWHAAWTFGSNFDVDAVDWNEACTELDCTDYDPDSCGAAPDGCGDFLDCGTCGGGDVCDSGFQCCTPDASWCANEAPPKDCNSWFNNCDVIVDCGTCTGNDVCLVGVCCTPEAETTTCGANDCGNKDNNCGQSIDCDVVRGTCDARVSGEVCLGNGTCGAGSEWWETTLKPTAANTGPNCQGRAGCPSATLLPGNAPPSTVTQDGATYENFTSNGTSFTIAAQNVTFRNFYISHNDFTGIFVDDVSNANFLMEYGEMVGGGSCGQHMDGNGYIARYTNFHSCDDISKINNSTGSNGPVVVEDSYWWDAHGGHGDTVMMWPTMDAATTFKRNTLESGNNAIFINDDIQDTFLVENNWMENNSSDPSVIAVYCDNGGGYTNTFTDNLWATSFGPKPISPATDPGCTWSGNLWDDDYSTVAYP